VELYRTSSPCLVKAFPLLAEIDGRLLPHWQRDLVQQASQGRDKLLHKTGGGGEGVWYADEAGQSLNISKQRLRLADESGEFSRDSVEGSRDIDVGDQGVDKGDGRLDLSRNGADDTVNVTCSVADDTGYSGVKVGDCGQDASKRGEEVGDGCGDGADDGAYVDEVEITKVELALAEVGGNGGEGVIDFVEEVGDRVAFLDWGSEDRGGEGESADDDGRTHLDCCMGWGVGC